MKPELKAAFAHFEIAIEENITATEKEFADWTWRTDRLWEEVLKPGEKSPWTQFSFGAEGFWTWRGFLYKVWPLSRDSNP
jgi:hypothetical protein